jgi:hypothetical protein
MTNIDQVRESIEAVVNYNWQDEEQDFLAQDEEDREDHIFVHLKRLSEFLGTPAEVREWTADKAIERAMTSTQPDLGMTSKEEAEYCARLVEQSGREDKEALMAHDRFHYVAVYGNAW